MAMGYRCATGCANVGERERNIVNITSTNTYGERFASWCRSYSDVTSHGHKLGRVKSPHAEFGTAACFELDYFCVFRLICHFI